MVNSKKLYVRVMMSNKKSNHVQNKINNLNSKQTLHNISYFYAKLLCSNQNLKPNNTNLIK